MVECTHEHLVEGYYGHDCAVCGVLVYPYGQEPWNVPDEAEMREQLRAWNAGEPL